MTSTSDQTVSERPEVSFASERCVREKALAMIDPCVHETHSVEAGPNPVRRLKRGAPNVPLLVRLRYSSSRMTLQLERTPRTSQLMARSGSDCRTVNGPRELYS